MRRRPHQAFAEDGSNHKFERIPVAGNAQPGPGRHERRERGVAAELLCQDQRVRGEIEQRPYPRRDFRKSIELGDAKFDPQAAVVAARHLDDAFGAADVHRSAIAVSVDAFDPGYRPPREHVHHRGPVVGRRERQVQNEYARRRRDAERSFA